jgi:hypothetical protein
MEILEQRADWEKTFRSGWLAHHQQTGALDWKRYHRLRNASEAALASRWPPAASS